MLRTKTMVSTVSVIPREWVFEYYLSIPSLHGQDLKLKSPFNPGGDKLPSFFIYYSNNKYMFKDFSTDRQGDGVELVKELFKLKTRGEAAHKIIEDYNKYMQDNPNKQRIIDFKVEKRYQVDSFITRNWNEMDKKYWTAFRIGSKLLAKYNIKPLQSYVLVKEKIGGKKDIRLMNQTVMYGFFKIDGTLYKIYQPYIKTKFIKVKLHIQGMDQLTYDKDYLIICSSLKDLMAFTRLNIKNVECVAPDSENTPIPEVQIKDFKKKYKQICTLFDNDEAGIKSMVKYKKLYDIPYVHLELEKDMADNIKEHGIENTRIHLYPLLTKALTGKTKQV